MLMGQLADIGIPAASVTETLTALGTLAAVIVALGISIVPALFRWHRRPRLVVRVSDVEPHVVTDWLGL
jgi:hypothetical protein